MYNFFYKIHFLLITIIFTFNLKAQSYEKDTVLINKYIKDSRKAVLQHNPKVISLYADSINEILNRTDYPRARAKYYNLRGTANWLEFDYDSANYYFRQSIKISKQINDEKNLLIGYNNLGALLFTCDSIDEGLKYLEKAYQLSIKQNDKKSLLKILIDIGNALTQKNDYRQALVYYKQADSLSIAEQDSSYLTNIYISKGVLLHYLGLDEASLTEFRKGLEHNLKHKENNLTFFFYENMSLIFKELDMLDSSEYFARMAIDSAKFYNIINIYEGAKVNLSGTLNRQKKYRESIEVLSDILDSKSKMIFTAANINTGLGYLEINPDSAKYFIDRGMKVAKENNFYDFMVVGYNGLIIYDTLNNDYKSAYYHANELLKLKDSMNSREVNEIKASLETKYKLESEKQKKNNWKEKSKLSEEIIKRKNINLYLFSTLFLISVFVVFVLMIMKSRQKKISDQLQKARDAQEETNRNLIKLNKLKTTLLSILSHDLRSNIAPANQLINELFKNYKNISDEDRIKIIAAIRITSDKIVDMMNNLLDWSKLQFENIELSVTEVNLNKIIGEVLEGLNMKIEKKQIEIINNVENNIIVKSNPDALKTILRNLITNAIKFTPAGKTVEIYGKTEREKYILCVKDTGMGMPEEVVKNIFSMESRYHNLGTENEKGSGLGLKLVKSMIDHIGSEITVTSVEGEGSEFCFSLKLSR